MRDVPRNHPRRAAKSARLAHYGRVIARHVVVHGQVQGVGFRWWAAREAARLGVTGWVRNRADGAVEALVQGDPQPVEAMVEELSSGPRHAAVSSVDVEQAEPTGDLRFVVEP